MPTITTKAGVEIFYKAGGDPKGQAIVFSHGWPLSGDAWAGQLVFFGNLGYHVIAHDRRGHGKSTATWDGNTMDAYADDLAELIEQLDLKDIILIGHSTGGGEVTRYVGRHGTARVAKVVLVGAVPPLMLKTEANPGGLPIDVFDGIRKGTYDNRSQFYLDLTMPFYGYNREGAAVSEGMRQSFWLMGMQGALKPQLDSIKEFSESDFHEDFKKFDVPTLVVHGDDDQIVPIEISGRLTASLIPNAILKEFPGGAHGLAQVQQDTFNEAVLAFIKS